MGSQLLEQGLLRKRERGGDFFQGEEGCSFYIKNELKSEVFDAKKSL